MNLQEKNFIQFIQKKDLGSFLETVRLKTPSIHIPDDLTLDQEYLIRLLYLSGQHHFLQRFSEIPDKDKFFLKLQEIDAFYFEKGGILGYQKLIEEQLQQKNKNESQVFCPIFLNITQKNEEIAKYIDAGLELLPKFCEIYVVGGAADRLGFFHPDTKEPLPAASFLFMGKPLLEHLIDDLNAREYLYYKKYQKKISVPICLMTADEKNNFNRIKTLLEEKKYFGRPKNSFIFIRQPMVPVVDSKGNWIWDDKEILALKPSGHGALWTACLKQNIYAELKKRGCEYALVRQINNPIIGVDYNLLAFMGAGVLKNKSFGFFVTKRIKGNPEGAVVYTKVKNQENEFKVVTNVEYCQLGNEDISEEFPANTNLLFANLNDILHAVEKVPYPGTLLNFKSNQQNPTARLELTMQNIAEGFLDPMLDCLQEHQSVFLVMQERSKAISTIKKLKNDLKEQNETPLKAFYDYHRMTEQMLIKNCFSKVPKEIENFEEFIKNPNFFFFYHKMLGPLFDEIAKKIQYLVIKQHAYIDIQLAECKLNEVTIEGALIIESSESIEQIPQQLQPCCFLENVTVNNLGVDLLKWSPFLQKGTSFQEVLKITLSKNSRFFAKNRVFTANKTYVVPENYVFSIDGEQESLTLINH